MEIESSPIVRRKLSDDVTDRLKTLITSGRIQAGEALPSERELMELFKVGRPAVREALQNLSTLGLVVTGRGERSRVRKVTAKSILQQMDNAVHLMFATQPASLDHLKDARLFFERGMVRQAAEKASADQIRKLHAILQNQRDNLGDQDVFISADTQFHIQIATISGNPIYESVSEAMLKWLKAYHTHMLVWVSRETRTLDEHELILDAIEAHDPEAAEAAMISHLKRTADLYALPLQPQIESGSDAA